MRPAYIGVAAQLTVALLLNLTPAESGRCESMSPASPTQTIQLPDPRTDGNISV